MYCFLDVIVDSNIELPELPTATEELPADVCIEFAPASDGRTTYPWFHHWYVSRTPRISTSIARENGGFRLRYPGTADVVINAMLNHVVCIPNIATSPNWCATSCCTTRFLRSWVSGESSWYTRAPYVHPRGKLSRFCARAAGASQRWRQHWCAPGTSCFPTTA